MGYQFYNSLEQKVFISKHVVFLEKVFFLRDNESKVELEEVQDAQTFSKSMCPRTQDERTRISLIPYASTLGSIMYSMICTKLNVSHALSVTIRYQLDSSEGHWVAVKNFLST